MDSVHPSWFFFKVGEIHPWAFPIVDGVVGSLFLADWFLGPKTGVFWGGKPGSTIRTLLNGKIDPKD